MTALVTAWQAALAAEHRAVFGYGVLGPHLSPFDQELARADQAAHATLRDSTEAAMSAAGIVPVAPAVDYPSVYPVSGAAAARRTAIEVEDFCADAWRFAYLRAAARSDGPARRIRAAAQTALSASAVRAVRWRALATPARATTAFPGL